MVYLVDSSPVNVPRIYPHASADTPPISLKGFPTFYGSDHQYLMPVNLWMNYLVNLRKSKILNSAVLEMVKFSFLPQAYGSL
jgi:hypothetical protein